ncbi:UDP-N-acetylmuramoyl-L-alanyl-D-glutamate--2,6-diaminopimelate ligase [Thaumasiovibrio sp. DFM-14]|uniref:UDP-N-acetylmuramoyl-L-alanyl-D-glutamate--2, 6-diaminopimelate ligase n=1 Tax=Thaumasiovibrio sp. DFM-14 TaxID=3384792 RepID=UPI0039A082F7
MPRANKPNIEALLLPWFEPCDSRLASIEIQQLQIDSREVKSGDMFIAVIGHQCDGNQFIAAAQQAGASAVLSHVAEAEQHGKVEWIGEMPVIRFFKLNEALSAIAQRFYFCHQTPPQVIGITGTNGKTTISQLIAQWITLMGDCCGVMGTTGNGLLGQFTAAANTTGSAVDIQAWLAKMQQQGASTVALEVSSHGLVQHRVKAVEFQVGVFTNLSRDHLDYHGDMAGYAAAKQTLFTEHKTHNKVINVDDPVGNAWLAQLPDAIAVSATPESTYVEGHTYLVATHVELTTAGMQVEIDSSWGQGRIQAPLVGAFNVSNLLLAMATMLAQGYSLQGLLATAPKLCAVIGRMEVFHQPDKPMLVVDYAHTPDALEKALQALRVHCQGTLWCIFGCGGDRDKGKRSMMAAVAEKHADKVILTDDNPRSEDPKAIVADMLTGVNEPDAVMVRHDRHAAIQFAVTQASADDIVLVAGKGHEDYQVLADKTIHYSDRETAATILGGTA